MSLHYATLERSPRLQRFLAALKAHPQGLTTRELIQEANVCAVNSCAAELKAQGFRIECRPEGKSIYRYILEGT